MRVYLKTEKILDANNFRAASEIIAGGNVLRVQTEKTEDGERYFVDCSFPECEVLNSMGMTAPDPILGEKVPPKKKKSAPKAEPKAAAEAKPTSVTELQGIPANVIKALRRKYKTVESLQGVRAADLEEVKGIGPAMAKKIVKAAK